MANEIPEPYNVAPISVLLVEDNDDDVLIVRQELEDMRGRWFHLEHAARLSAGLDRLAQRRFDAVLLDLSLPDSQGLGTIHRVRRDFPDIPIVVVSSHEEETLLATALEVGIQDYVVKGSFNGAGLGRAIQYAIRRQHAETERLRLESRLQTAQRVESLSVLAGGVAHDFNNILTGIMGNAEMLLMDLPADSQLRERVVSIATAATRAGELNEQLLAYAGKGDVEPRRMDLNAMLEETGQLVRTLISKKADLKWELTPDLPEVVADPTQLQQVAMNLAINASEALENEAGSIVVTTGTTYASDEILDTCHHDGSVVSGTYVYFAVADTGCGIDPETMERLFDPFFTTKPSGRGLGLAAVLGIIARHGGALSVTSKAGEGSSFKVLLPRAQSVTDIVDDDQEPVSVRQGGTVMVVDDEASVRSVVAETLRRFGLNVIAAQDGRQALTLFNQSHGTIDVVVLDLAMPKMDGRECFHALRMSSPQLPIVIMSGYDDRGAIKELVRDGATRFLQKPFRTNDLLETIACVAEDA